MVTVPYVSAAAFQAHPTYLDLDDLRVDVDDPAAQTAELENLLLMSSQWAADTAMQPLHAHVFTQRTRARTDRQGNLKFHLDHTPYLSLVQVGYGYSPTALTVMNSPTVWEQDNNLTIPLGQGGGSWSGSLQFGFPAGVELWVQAVCVAGFVATRLTADTTAGALTLTVDDPTGILPGAQYRIWEPGAEETVTVSPAWTPPAISVPPTAPAPAAVTLATPTRFAHTSGHDFSGMPANLRLAVVNYNISQLMRPDTAAEDSYPDTHLASRTRQTDPRKDGSGLVAEAERIINSYWRVR
ncbi:hypothetical protein ITX44_36630 [Streptomyces sp. KK5PA1]|uniref:Uncharacterized protein n=1 Tax=Actinacidiphila acididurans TaxID=2784346 RepID=A0ABS2U666_9ACTN|nr:hypothetical protein [Actinacidiphila acididurans]